MRHLPLFERHIEPEDLECDEHARTVAAYGKGQWEVATCSLDRVGSIEFWVPSQRHSHLPGPAWQSTSDQAELDLKSILKLYLNIHLSIVLTTHI
ncbi:hypothetical protein CVT25_012422 [Psilocybe cyanescens]|uniref:Uncharacterized protein n=1 Tax=Psilocybe cyanescens TaxID=93625 RepID=A0A409X7S7_PSICY|nr:hypothetical protein CVT25_012422 [Psilocybe cyanescens]